MSVKSSEIELLWSSYLEDERRGLRRAALATLQRLIDELDADPLLRDEWARTLLRRREKRGHDTYPIRTPLFEKVLFPFLSAQYRAGDPDAATWLARLRNIRARACWDTLEWPGTRDLWREAHRRNPSNEEARKALIAEIAFYTEYTIHALPSGVLFGADGATREECAELQNDLAELQTLLRGAEAEQFAALIGEAEFHYRAYSDYLADKEGHQNYESFFKARATA